MELAKLKILMREKNREAKAAMASLRYLRVISKLVELRALGSNRKNLEVVQGQVHLEDALWAGQYEPRIFEMLPAVLVKAPGTLVYEALPPDLSDVMEDLKEGRVPRADFRGIPAGKIEYWVRNSLIRGP